VLCVRVIHFEDTQNVKTNHRIQIFLIYGKSSWTNYAVAIMTWCAFKWFWSSDIYFSISL